MTTSPKISAPAIRAVSTAGRSAKKQTTRAVSKTVSKSVSKSVSEASSSHEESILVLQGGGALGAYQAGVFEGLSDDFSTLDWVAGISIGAINAALIAGNPAGQRVARLREFWELLSSALPAPVDAFMQSINASLQARQALNAASAGQVMLCGVPGFFSPRLLPAALQPSGTLEAISFYDTAPLLHTLNRLVDFDRINAGGVRLSVGAVNVRTGNFEYFDSARQKIDARHIMASGALPPGFAPVEIDGEFYWDGGIVSNTPLQYVLDQPGNARRVVFQVDLFSARGDLPATMDEASAREKDIRFSSRTRQGTTSELDRQVMAQAAQRLLAKLPAALRNDPDALALAAMRCESAVDVVHLIYRSKHYESQSKDYEFSRLSMQEHWASGRADMVHTLHDPRWAQRAPNEHGVRVFDLTCDADGKSVVAMS